ncbi:hypothetical protein [Parasulfuritortus cantonensis]|nr:hypothetical protein [Parasulfuritortus cantonensis]
MVRKIARLSTRDGQRIIGALLGGLHGWLVSLGMGQDGPAGTLPEDLRAR